MTKPFIQIGDETREMTDAEYAQYEKDQADNVQRKKEDAAKAATRAATIAKLGLTADEIASLFG